VNLSILDGNEIMVIERFRSNSLFSMNLSVGSRLPIYCTSQGLAILAFLNPKRREAILKTLRLKPVTPNTILDKERIRAPCPPSLLECFNVVSGWDGEGFHGEEAWIGAYLCWQGHMYGE